MKSYYHQVTRSIIEANKNTVKVVTCSSFCWFSVVPCESLSCLCFVVVGTGDGDGTGVLDGGTGVAVGVLCGSNSVGILVGGIGDG